MIQSMTAFTRKQAQGDWGVAVFECRTVNHRYLEPSFRLPETFRLIEPKLREITREYCQRGKLDVYMRFQAGAGLEVDAQVNLPLAKSLIKASDAIANLVDEPGHIRTMDILRWPGMVILQEENLDAVQETLLDLYRDAMQSLVDIRKREGQAIETMISDRLDILEQEVTQINARIGDIIQAEQDKIRERIAQLQLDMEPTRVEQELVYLTQKADVAEEIDRLQTHIKEVRRVLKKGGVVGRRLDFLMQELNREANTLGSKSIHADSSQASVSMKVIIEQMREQIQNIE